MAHLVQQQRQYNGRRKTEYQMHYADNQCVAYNSPCVKAGQKVLKIFQSGICAVEYTLADVLVYKSNTYDELWYVAENQIPHKHRDCHKHEILMPFVIFFNCPQQSKLVLGDSYAVSRCLAPHLRNAFTHYASSFQ